MRPIELSARLRSVAELVPQGARFADVGTDHAYLPVSLLQRGVVERAIASDLRPGPLARARATAERYGMAGRLDFRLCDGLSGIGPEEADTIAMAGMGGETIAAILAAAPWTGEGAHRFLLQPMSAQEDLRLWLQQNGFTIAAECLSREGDALYTTFLVHPGPMPPLTPAQLWAGRQAQGQAPLREAYLEGLLRRAERAAAGLRRSTRPEDRARLDRMEEIRVELSGMIKEWKAWQR